MQNDLSHYYVAIMAGGVGSRFWPASRDQKPKQFLDILGVGKSLIRLTFERFLSIIPAERILVVTHKNYKSLTQEHLPEIPEQNIITEPSRNNTGPCVAYTAFRLQAMDPKAVFVIAPSDHVILKEDEFLEHIKEALDYAAHNEAIVTLGIQPSRPDTGYGYIETSEDSRQILKRVSSFREKPDLATAEEYLRSGNYYWNAGIFIWSAMTILQNFKKDSPDIYSILATDVSKYNTSGEQDYIDSVYPTTPSISVDYAILEKARNVFTIPVDIGWSDLGTWNSLHAYIDKDSDDTVLIGENTIMIDSKNCLVKTDPDKLVIIKDLDGFIVVDEEDVLLIYPKNKEQEIKQIRSTYGKGGYL